MDSEGKDQTPVPFRSQLLNGIDVADITLESIQSHLKAGRFTSEELTQHCLSRVHATNKYLEFVVELNPDAARIARDSDQRRQDGKNPLSMLDGIPVLVKDNMASLDVMETTAGSFALLGSRPPCDSHIVARLRRAGAVIVGKSNMEEWAGGRSTSYSSGYSPRGGQTRNPYDLTKEPSGSSGGSAVAVASGIVPIAFGTETDSSIIWPAIKNGVCGIKPTVGVTSRAGVIPISRHFDSVGPLARNILDAAHALDVIAGPDANDEATLGCDEKRPTKGYVTFTNATSEHLKGARFGLPMKRCFEVVQEDHKKLAYVLFDALKEAGAEIVPVDFPSIEERSNEVGQWNWRHKQSTSPHQSEVTVVNVDFYNDVSRYLSSLTNTSIKSFEDIVNYNKSNTGTEGGFPGDHPAFHSGQDNLEQVLATKGIEDETYHQALAWIRQQTRQNGLNAALDGFSFSHTPTHPAPSPSNPPSSSNHRLDALLVLDRKGIGMQYAAQATYPIVNIPLGLDDEGMPIGLSLHHTAWQDGTLIKWAAAIEDLWTKTRQIQGKQGTRDKPTYRNWTAKNVPIDMVD